MVCHRCQRRFRNRGNGACPFCGETNPPMTSGVMKTSTILISAGRTDAVYRSVSDVPHPLRRRLLKSTSGMNSETILIADRRGKEELARAICRLPGNAPPKLLDALLGESGEVALHRLLKPHWRKAIPIAIAVLVSLAVWFTVGQKF